ncbi:MAG TPA: rhodanese-like domain-containing protein, partial [Ignavibacteriaceae bacterium]
KDKTIVTYCTGGIRCEKASAYLVERGFKDVYQLDGGIVNFTKKFPDTFWEGGIFVFDERRVVNPNVSEELKHIAKCYFCGNPTSYYINCHNVDCDKIIVSCHECKVENEYCCSDECRKSLNKRRVFHG